nr:hypothetical protein [Shinella sumterensis]
MPIDYCLDPHQPVKATPPYEGKNYPILAASPVEVVKSVMAANNYTRADLVAVIGSKARAADLLNGKREINLERLETSLPSR